jgi:DNA-directed RNA polymerase specialized sigma24 family protein
LIFKLVKEEGLKCREVAEVLQISTRSVENQVYRAIKKLDEILTPFLEKKVTNQNHE